MNQRRTAMVIAAIVIGVVAAIGVFLYTKSAQDRAYQGAKRVEVLVVKGVIPKGTQGQDAIDKKLIDVGTINQDYRPANAIATKDQLKGKVAVIDLSPNQVVVGEDFVLPSVANSGLGGVIPTGQVAVTVSLDSVRAVGGNLTPDSIVDIATVDDGRLNPDGSNATKGDDQIRLLYQNVRILALGTEVATPAGAEKAGAAPAPAASGLITFSVPVVAGERITAASQSEAGLYLYLVPKANIAAHVDPVSTTNVFPPDSELTPYPAS